MKLFVTDGKHNATTDLYVYVDDVNDNAPQFEKNLYEITISEEDYNVPKTLFVVKAIDADKVGDFSCSDAFQRVVRVFLKWNLKILRAAFASFKVRKVLFGKNRLLFSIFVPQQNL